MGEIIKVLSLFSGVGGFDLGLEQAGMETIYQCEWDENCQKILARHWPDVPKWGDISTLTGAEILRHGIMPDVVAWGSPCQDLSVAGSRAGLGGERSGLFYEGIRIINEIRSTTHGKYPRISIWENVTGALSSRAGADFGQVLYEMDEAGACFSEWAVLDAQYFGVPQRRRRVFVVSVFDPSTAERCPEPLLPVGKSVRRGITTGITAKEGAPEGVTGCFGGSGESLLIDGRRQDDVRVYTPPVQTLEARMGTGGNNVPIIFSHTQGLDPQPSTILSPTLRREGGGMAVAIIGPLCARDYKGVSYQFVEENKLVVNGARIRKLTPLECERLMGWPDDHTKYGTNGEVISDTQRYKMCGNGVASPVAKWIGREIYGSFRRV